MFLLKILGLLIKIIGILLLVILTLLLTLLLILLFVPLRYKAEIKKEGEMLLVQAKVSFLASLLCIPVSFEEGKLKFRVRVLWFTLFSSENSGKEKMRKSHRKPKEAKQQDMLGEAEAKIKTDGEIPEKSASDRNAAESEQAETTGNQNLQKDESSEEEKHSAEQAQPENGAKPDQSSEEHTGNPFVRLLHRLWEIVQKLKEGVNKLLNFCRHISQSLRSSRDKMKLVSAFLKDEMNQKGIKITLKSFFKLIKYILPYKIKGEILFGTGNAYRMGQILSVLGMFYPVYAKKLAVRADFETEEFLLEMKLDIKGRIRFGTILLILGKAWFQGKLKVVLANIKNLKSGLMESADVK